MLLQHNHFEELLSKHEQLTRGPVPKQDLSKPLKATKNATLEDFISMLAEVCSRSLKRWQAKLIPDEGATLKDEKNLNNPVILYEVIDRVPKLERKPRQLEDVIEEKEPGKQTRLGRIWSQRFSCIVQFNIVASDYVTANEVMTTLEDTIFTYTGYFKSKGVAELIFRRHFTDKSYDRYRQGLSVRSLQYDIEIEKLTTVFDTTIEEISI